jgi:hypothetical protein
MCELQVFNDICVAIIIEQLLKITQMLIFSYLLYIVGADRFRGFHIYITDNKLGVNMNI